MCMKKRILVIGSISIDNTIFTKELPKAGTTTPADTCMTNVGGKGANQAAASLFLGGEVSFIGAVGKDSNGELVKKLLKDISLNAYIKESDEPTGVAFIIIEETTGENRILIVQGANTDLTIEDIDRHSNLFKEGDILLTQFECSIDTVQHIIKKAHDSKMTVIVNPAPYKEMEKEYFQYIDYLVPNEHETEQLTGITDVELSSRALLDWGVKNVITTLGEKGSILINNETIIKVAPYKVNAVDTTAAGDSYLGALVTKLAEGKDIIEAMEFASLASSVTVTRKGAIIALPRLDDLNSL